MATNDALEVKKLVLKYTIRTTEKFENVLHIKQQYYYEC